MKMKGPWKSLQMGGRQSIKYKAGSILVIGDIYVTVSINYQEAT